MKPLKSYWQLSSFYYFYCFALGAWIPYWPLYLQSIGHGALVVGITGACFNASRVIAPNLWGYIADHYGHRLLLIRLGSILSCCCFLWIFIAESVLMLCVIIFLFSFFWSAILPQVEVLTLSKLRSKVAGYGRIRLWGSIGFIVSVLGLGWVYDWINIRWFPYVIVICLLLMIMSGFLVRRDSRTSSVVEKSSSGFKKHLKQRWFWGFLAMVLLMQVCFAPYYSFFSIYLTEAGYHSATIGFLWTVGILSEIVLFQYIGSLLKLFNLRNIVLFSILLTIIRWVALPLFLDNIVMLIIVQTFHAFGFGAFHAGVLEYIRQMFHYRQQGRGQAMVNSIGFGLGAMIGAVISGLLWDSLHSQLYYLAAIIALCALILGYFSLPKLKPVQVENLIANVE